MKFKENLLVVLVGIINLFKKHVLKTYTSGIPLCIVDMTMNKTQRAQVRIWKTYKQINPEDDRIKVFKECKGHKGGNNQFYTQTKFCKPMLCDLRLSIHVC